MSDYVLDKQIIDMWKPYETSFISKVRMLAYGRKMNYNQLAEELNIPKNTFYRYEKTPKMPSAQLLIKISEAYGVSINWLLGIEKDEDAHITQLYNIATNEDKNIVDAILDKYEGAS